MLASKVKMLADPTERSTYKWGLRWNVEKKKKGQCRPINIIIVMLLTRTYITNETY